MNNALFGVTVCQFGDIYLSLPKLAVFPKCYTYSPLFLYRVHYKYHKIPAGLRVAVAGAQTLDVQ